MPAAVVTWATSIGIAYYYIGNTVKHVRGPLDIVLAAVAVAVIVGFFLYIRRTEERYAVEAEKEFPGPLEQP